MATGRELKNRINSVQNTRKITRTMELVSTAKSKKAVDNVDAARPFADKIKELIASIAGTTDSTSSDLLRVVDKPTKTAIIMLAANRGLCGGYNNNIVKIGQDAIKDYASRDIETEVHVVGKKAIASLNFTGTKIDKAYSEFDDQPAYTEVEKIANELMNKFISGEIDQVEVIYTKYYSAGKQRAITEQILPLQFENADLLEDSTTNDEMAHVNMSFEPSPEVILTSLLPRAIRMAFFSAFLDNAASEQIARRIAMKSATEAASDMIKELNITYNRARQAKITQEIAEIVGGAAASE